MSKGADTLLAVGLFVTFEAKPGKEDDLAAFLKGALPLAEQEPQTTAWFAARLAPSRFAIFDAFPSEAGREAHLAGAVATALMDNAPELLASDPNIESVDVLADKLPRKGRWVGPSGRRHTDPAVKTGNPSLPPRGTGNRAVGGIPAWAGILAAGPVTHRQYSYQAVM